MSVAALRAEAFLVAPAPSAGSARGGIDRAGVSRQAGEHGGHLRG